MNRTIAPLALLICWSADAALAAVESNGAAIAIYRCAGGQGLVFSDRPCSGRAERVWLEPDRINRYQPPVVPANDRDAENRSPRTARGPLRRAVSAHRCDTLRARVARLDARMRQGYGGRSGERLRDARRTARRALTERGCR